ncbi:MAG TPA: hypothetical protein DEA08_05170 [Planctomycetes bacterium]|nr:hypothetical protein [Planctomycetota bacterium]
MRFSPALLAGALTSLALAAPSDAQTVRELARETAKAMVAVEHRVTRAGSFQEGENPLDAQARSSGFVASPEGHVITHARFVKGRTRLQLFLSGGVKAWARTVGVDPLNETAILRLEKPERVAKRFGGKLPHLTWGDSSALRLGQTVFTIGNCFDSLRLDGQPTFSQGVITMIDRVRRGAYRGVVVETDASVNPGSFGGPLLDARGRVVGVLTRNVNSRRWLGAAVPGDQVRHNMERIVAGKPLSRGRFGVALKKTGGEASPKGLEVTRVLPDSGAAQAGIKPGDRLLRVAGTRVYDTYDVARELTNLSPGTPLKVRLVRGEQTLTLRVVLSEGGEILAAAQKPEPKPTRPEPKPQPRPQPKAGERVRLGVRVQAREAGPGLEVVEVDPDSPASEAGLQKGDIVVAMGRTQIRSMDDFATALARYRPGQTERVIVLRDRRARLLRLTFGGGSQAQKPTPKPQPQQPQPRPTNQPGYLGVYLAPGGEGQGALVDGCVVGSPADQAGLESGDRIVAVDGERVATDDDLAGLLRSRRAGEKVVLGVERGSRRLALSVTLGVRGEEPNQPRPKPQPSPQAGRPYLGVSLVDGEGGVEIRQVAPNSPLAKLGVEAGDLITGVDGRRTPTVAAFSEIWQRCRVGQTVEFDLERKGWGKTIRVRLSAKP